MDEDVFQRDHTQLPKVGRQFQGVDLLQRKEAVWDPEEIQLQQHRLNNIYCESMFIWIPQYKTCLTFPDWSLWILVSHTFFTNRRLLIWFLITLMSNEHRKQRRHQIRLFLPKSIRAFISKKHICVEEKLKLTISSSVQRAQVLQLLQNLVFNCLQLSRLVC